MSAYNILNEDGILSTILDIAEEIRDTDVEEIFDKATRDSHKLSTTSLARRTENLICTFPVMVSTSLSIDTAVMIMKAIERKAVVMIQLLFSSYNFTGNDATEILGQFHKNIKIGGKIGLDDFIDVLDCFIDCSFIRGVFVIGYFPGNYAAYRRNAEAGLAYCRW